MEVRERPYFNQPVPDEKVLKYREITKILVKDLMERVLDKNKVFASYKILLSESTRENVRVGNPYEIDYLIQYDISANSKISEVSSCPGYVRIILCDDDDIAKYQSMIKDGALSCNKLMFNFLLHAYRITSEKGYGSQKHRLQLATTLKILKTLKEIVTEKNF